MQYLIALIVGILSYFVALLVFSQPISALIGLLIGLVVAFGDRLPRR